VRRDEIDGVLRQIVSQELGPKAVHIDDSLDAVDSLEKMQLATAIEDRFQIRLDRADEEEITSLDALAGIIERKLAPVPAS
jgi:acyl carrier protein